MVLDQKKDLYEKSLKVIKKIEFTNREIDVISCLLHNRGEKKIASILSISPRTVSAHTHNIMVKLSCNSRDLIIDFIEHSGKMVAIKEYYLLLLSAGLFKNELVKISKIVHKRKTIIHVNSADISSSAIPIFKAISQDLLLANVILEMKEIGAEIADFNIKILGIDNISQDSEKDVWIKIPQQCYESMNDEQFKDLEHQEISYINFSQDQEYYFSIFDLLSKVIHHDSVQVIAQEFSEKYNVIKSPYNSGSSEVYIQSEKIPKFAVPAKNFLLLGILLFMVSCFAMIKINTNIFDSTDQKIRLLPPIPNDVILLKRQELIQQISQKLASKDGIKSVVLVGPGGIGKTTLARQYAKNQDTSLILEINCETPETIMSAFERLAYFLAQNSEERSELVNIQKNENTADKQAKLVFLLSKKLKQYSDWLIIYDNVKSFKDIEKYFQYDAKVWGNGSVIITTTDENIANNVYIDNNNMINIEELSNKEKSQLFKSILVHSKDMKNSEIDVEVAEFLDNIPSFPLDVSIAAYYIKEENVSFDQYLEYLLSHKKDFFSEQKNILENIGSYKKTRYDIITLSVKNIIDSNQDFRDLLLMICMLHSQDIPKGLLSSYKNQEIVTKFLSELKRFSLILGENKQNQHSKNFSIHRNTKEVMMQYLTSESFENSEHRLNQIANAIIMYVEKEVEKYNFEKARYLMLHIETFLNNAKKLSDLNLANLYRQLGMCNFHIGNYEKAASLFSESTTKYQKLYGNNHIKSATASARLASVYRNIGQWDKARSMLESSEKIYQKYYGANNIQYAWVLVYLGSIYELFGDYANAEQKLDQALGIYQSYYDDDHIKIAWTSAYLGDVYTNLGNYQEALNILQKSLNIYQKYYMEDNTKIAWLSTRVGGVYRKMGNYKKSQELFKKSLSIYQKQYGDSSLEVAWCMVHLARSYQNLQEYSQALDLIQKGIKIYSNYLPNDHIIMAWANISLGDIYRSLKDYKTAISLLKRSYDLYSLHYGKNHIKTTAVLRMIGTAYFESGDLKNAKECFEEAKAVFLSLKHQKEVEICSKYLVQISE